MKKFYNLIIVLAIPALFKVLRRTRLSSFVFTLLLFSAMVLNSQATIWTVNVQNFSFNPSSLPDVMIGDTIRWIWVNGSHTTTSTTIPAGAASWDHPLNIEFPQFDYIPTVSGTYNYKCTPHAPGMVGSFIVSSSVGISEDFVATPFQVYPNPSSGIVTVNSDQSLKKIEVLNIHGQLVYSKETVENSEKLDLTGLLQGIYFIRSGKQTERLVIR
jgi:plastocyanin